MRDTEGKNIVFFTGQFWDFWIFVFNNMSSFRLVVKKSQKYTFRSLFYYSLSVCVCRFLINSTKVGVLNQHAAPRSLSAPCHHTQDPNMSDPNMVISFLSATSRESKRAECAVSLADDKSLKPVFSKWLFSHTPCPKSPLQ